MMLEIDIDADPEWDSSGGWESLVRSAAEAAIAESGFPELATSQRLVELSVRLTSDEQVKALNAQWRGKDKPTNVLSFPQLEPGELERVEDNGRELMLGDLVLARGVCEAEAAEKQIPFCDHAAHLLVHHAAALAGELVRRAGPGNIGGIRREQDQDQDQTDQPTRHRAPCPPWAPRGPG